MTGRDFKPGKDYDWVKNPKKLNPITGFPEGKVCKATTGLSEYHYDKQAIKMPQK